MIVEPGGHQYGCQIKPDSGRKISGYGCSDTHQQQRDQCQCLLFHQQQDKHHGKCQEPGDLAQRLEDADLHPGKGGAFNRKIIEQGLPGPE
jgi:hypothetical protein